MTSNNKPIKYIYDLPYLERRELCRILNRNQKWEELAGVQMQYTHIEICDLRNEKNPTDEVLTKWGHSNHTILQLFALLSRMEHIYDAMMLLKPFVDEKYHVLILPPIEEINEKPSDHRPLPAKNLETEVEHVPRAQNLIEKFEKMNVNATNEKNILNISGVHEQQNETASDSSSLFAPTLKILSNLPKVPYSTLSIATDNWRYDNLLGKGGFGTVYKGQWKNTDVAVKKILPKNINCDEALQLDQSIREVRVLNALPHENILLLYAYSIENGEAPCLVYQYMINGSLEDRLHLKNGSAPLNWLQRREIAKGTARGLQYLHTIHKKPLIHGDIKSGNILLDKNFEPKISDFGLVKEGPFSGDSMKVNIIEGTRPYLPKDYLLGKSLSTKIDTYSYGIVLFELATGLYVYDKTRPKNEFLRDYVNSFDDTDLDILKDKHAGETNHLFFQSFMAIGEWCTNEQAKNRPEMSEVFEKL